MGGVAAALISFADTSVLSRAYAAQAGRPVGSEPGDGRARRGQPRGGTVPGHSDQRQRLAHAGGRGRRREDAAGRGGRRAGRGLPPAAGAPDLLATLPKAALAAVVIASALALFEFRDLRRIHRIQRWEFWLSIACFVGVAVLGPIQGIALAIVIAVIEFLWDGWRPHSAVLGRVDGVKGYHDITPLSVGARRARAGAVPLGCAAVLRQRRVLPRPRARGGGRVADAGALAGGGRGAGDQRRRDRGRRRSRSWTRPCGRPASTSASPR